jgi:hypothetical protein
VQFSEKGPIVVEVEGPKVLWHSVHITFRKFISQEAKGGIWRRYQTMHTDCGGEGAGILLFRADWNSDQRKSVELVVVAIFTDDAALQAYRRHPKHTELTNVLQEIADWTVGDLHLPRALH